MTTQSALYKVSDIAEALGITERQVQKLAKNGILPKSARGQYDLKSCLDAYNQYIEQSSTIKGSDKQDIAELKKRLLAAQAEKVEFALAISRGEYAKCDDLEFEYGNRVLAFRSKMLSLPSKIIPKLIGAGNNFAKMESLIEAELHDALLELSKSSQQNDDAATS